ncbi:MAG: TetR/AcrR family transcriptional regulator [Lactobacillaceae bacterium]|jgi:AcrR family transcriptional regulator|nr:TetR/AcrR family transcriptional regulator [Lactobacillaceae bacterium]
MTEKQSRKRGAELETEILISAIQLLEEIGYDNLTYAAIATRAQTSRSVLYRRWDSIIELLHDAVTHQIKQTGSGNFLVDTTNTGKLRDDILSIVSHFYRSASTAGDEYMKATMLELARRNPYMQQLVGRAQTANNNVMNTIYLRALERGEITQVPNESIRTLPFELLRYRMFVVSNLSEIAPTEIEALIDDIVMPAVKAAQK